MHQKISFSAFFLGIIFFSSSFTFASAGETFLYLKSQVEQEINLSHLGLKNKKFLTFKAFEYEESEIFYLGSINKKILTKMIDEEKNYSSYENAIENTTRNFSQIDIWDYLAMKEKTSSREEGLEEYLFLAKDSLSQGVKHQKFLESSLDSLEKQISAQKKKVKNLEENFLDIVKNQDENAVIKAKAEIVDENKMLKKMQLAFTEKKYQYKSISPDIKTLRNKIQAIEENRDALVKNVKTKKSSGEFIGTVVE